MSAADAKPDRALENFARALGRLEEALTLDQPAEVKRDVVILRFVLSFETAWKALRHRLLIEQIEARYPKEAFQQAYRAGWLDDEAIWIGMLNDRNLIAHTYNEPTAERIFANVNFYVPALRRLLECLRLRAAG
jgi:nucleotidyltransferase substrate binding protein (TIGR01987 family)